MSSSVFSALDTKTCSVCVILVLTACGQSKDMSEQTRYVGQVSDVDDATSIAVVVQGDDVAAYVCPEDPVAERYARWFSGRLDGVRELRLQREGWRLDGSWMSGVLRGTLTSPEGAEWKWTVAPARGAAGLYGGHDAGCLTGVIVMTESREPLRVRGAWCNDQGDVAQVTPVSEPWVGDDALAVEVALDSQTRHFTVSPVDSSRLWP